ncbi:hypothetical protein GJ688_19195 [Heliobacillus mobilis]|uniref:Uncharacterized protein n=1 Tax=Heliobacterium mobile TaxID=28064 RepID=A0A6I3SPP5_HELMO|nr:hypothetical protein [Heliobacterium mobile]MTV51030.1 hypothetical protein [Heliobacterium mobile]
MFLETVFEPSLIFIHESDWEDEYRRDQFLKTLISFCNVIDKYKFTKIYWNQELDAILWTDPVLPPWRINRDWKLKIIPTLYRTIKSNSIDLVFPDNLDICQVEPPLMLSIRKDISYIFLKIVHYLITQNKQIYLCLGNNNSTNNTYKFSCNCHDNSLLPININNADDWFHHLGVENVCWPNSMKDLDKLVFSIEFTAMHHIKKKICNKFSFSQEFIKIISKESIRKKEILFSITKRLVFNQYEAASDHGLQDESLNGNEKERRFRVNREHRIHYEYQADRTIFFTKYFGEGEHDSGL